MHFWNQLQKYCSVSMKIMNENVIRKIEFRAHFHYNDLHSDTMVKCMVEPNCLNIHISGLEALQTIEAKH